MTTPKMVCNSPIRSLLVLLVAVILVSTTSCNKKSVPTTAPVTTTTTENNETQVSGASIEEDDQVYNIVDEMPKFRGGSIEKFRKYVVAHLDYPDEIAKMGISGSVYVNFVVDKNGKVTKVKVVRSIHPLLDNAAVRVVSSSPIWTPGKFDGKNVAVQFTIPIVFILM